MCTRFKLWCAMACTWSFEQSFWYLNSSRYLECCYVLLSDTGEIYCNTSWDQASCWPRTPANTSVSIPCPSYLPGINASSKYMSEAYLNPPFEPTTGLSFLCACFYDSPLPFRMGAILLLLLLYLSVCMSFCLFLCLYVCLCTWTVVLVNMKHSVHI